MSVEKTVVVREEEVLLVNGTPITLVGEEGMQIKVGGVPLVNRTPSS